MRLFADLPASWRRHWHPLAAILLCTVAGLAQAQTVPADDSADPPSRVARLAYISGDLGFLPAGASDWGDADLNRPLTSGDRLSTGDDTRAALELGGASLRLADRTDLGLLNLDDQLAQFELTQGTLNLGVRRLDSGQSYEIDTPTVALVVDRPGTFRVDIDNGGTRITVLDGQATVYGENQAQRDIYAGRSYRFDDSDLASVAVSDIGGGDAFDAWCNERDRRYAQSTSGEYVSDEVVGYQDLDEYGSWQTSSDYGAVWFPTQVGADWAPYRDGRWAYVAPWGWTWVDDSPWGFAPYHYGRWTHMHGRWGWIPGPRHVRPIYAPALVAFVGGGGWSVGIGSRPVGWFPLGPGEIYNPWYRASQRYYTNVNIHNIHGRRGHNRRAILDDVHNHYNRYRNGLPVRGERYANRTAPRGFTAMPGNAFAGGRHAQRDRLHVDPRKFAAAPVLSRGIDMRPVAGGIAPRRNPHARALPSGGFNRNVVARSAPPETLPTHRGAFTRTAPGPQSADAPFANVRVLNRGNQGRQFGTDQPRPLQTRGHENTRVPSRLPVTTNTAANLPVVHPIRAAEPRSAELPSARFARPRAGDDADIRRGYNAPGPRQRPSVERSTPRPGVSYISDNSRSDNSRAGNSRNPERTSRAGDSLPQVPRMQRMPSSNPSAQRQWGNAGAVRAETPRMPRNNPPPRSEPGNNPPPRQTFRETPRPYREPSPRAFQPRQEAPRAMPRSTPPQPRVETPRPTRQSAGKSAPTRTPHSFKREVQQQ